MTRYEKFIDSLLGIAGISLLFAGLFFIFFGVFGVYKILCN